MKLPRSVKIYLGIILAVGSVLLVGSIIYSNLQTDSTILAGVLFFILFGAISESLPVRIEGENLVSTSDAVSVAAILLFDLPTAIIVRFMGAILAVRKNQTNYTHLLNTPIYKSLFNGYCRGIAVFLAGLSYHNLQNIMPELSFIGFSVMGFMGSLIVYFATDLILFSILFSLLAQARLLDEINKRLLTTARTLALSPIGLIFAGIYNWEGILPIIFLVGPFLLTRQAIEQTHNRLEIQKKTETELRVSEEKFSKAFHASPMAIMIQRIKDRRYIDINEGFSRITGYSRQEVLEHTPYDLNLYPDQAASKKMREQFLTDGYIRDFEIPFRRKNGETGTALVWGETIDINNEKMAIAGTIDISDRKNLEILQAEQAQEMATLYEALSEITALHGDIKHLSKQIADIIVNKLLAHKCAVWLLDEEESKLTRIAFSGPNMIEKNDDILVDSPGLVNHTLKTGKSIYVPDVSTDPRYIAEDETTQSEFVVPLQAYGEVIGVINMESPDLDGFNDRTRRLVETFAQNATLALQNAKLVDSLEANIADIKETQARINFFLEHTAEGVYRIDFDPPIPIHLPFEEQFKLSVENGKIAECNEAIAHMYGFPSREEMLGTPYIDLYGEEGYDANLEGNLDFYHQGYQVDNIETEEYNIKGEKVHFLNNVVGIIRDDLFVATWGTQRDITPLKKVIAELEQRNAELERFTYTLSHELKSPIVSIRGFLGFLEQDMNAGNKERARHDLTRIGRAADKMYLMISELIELTRIGQLINPPEDVPFEEIALAGLNNAEASLQGHNANIHIQPDTPTVHVDLTRMIEVIQNLIENAIKYMGDQPEPQITIGVRSEKDEQIFFISDNGIGLDPAYHERVFNIFEKLDPQADGTGIGLALVKRIIEAHNGKVWVESEGLGKGTTFCFTLPTAKL